MSCPSSWSVAEVEAWGRRVRLSEGVVAKLVENDVDGGTLMTLTKDELRTELAIKSLADRRNFWDFLESLRSDQIATDLYVAVTIHHAETESFATAVVDPVEAISGRQNTAMIIDLPTSFDHEKHDVADFRIDNDIELDLAQQIYDDAEVARKEQQRIHMLHDQIESDRAIARDLNRWGSVYQDEFFYRKHPILGELSTISNLVNKHNADKTAQNGKSSTPVSKRDLPEKDSSDNSSSVEKSKQVGSTVEVLLDCCHLCKKRKVPGFQLACKHYNCVKCLKNRFGTAYHNASLLPLQCCNVLLDMKIAAKVLNEREEDLLFTQLNLQAKKKMNCPICYQFWNLDLIDSSFSILLQCKCGIFLCIACKTTAHHARSCQENCAATNTKTFLEIAKTGFGNSVIQQKQLNCSHK